MLKSGEFDAMNRPALEKESWKGLPGKNEYVWSQGGLNTAKLS